MKPTRFLIPLLVLMAIALPDAAAQVTNAPKPPHPSATRVPTSATASDSLAKPTTIPTTIPTSTPTTTPGPNLAASPPPTPATPAPEAMVMLLGQPLFKIYADSTIYPAGERAAIISARIDRFAHQLDTPAPVVHLKGSLAHIDAGPLTLLTVTEADAAAARLSVSQLAEYYTAELSKAIRKAQIHYNQSTLMLNVLLALGITLALGLLIWLLSRGLPPLQHRLEHQRQAWLPELRLRGLVLASSEQLATMLSSFLHLLRNVAVLALLYFYFPLVLSLFPWTQAYSGTLLGYLTTPLSRGWRALLNYLPNLFVIALVAILVNYTLKLIRLVFRALEHERISYPGFYREWAHPTYSILRFLILAFVAGVMRRKASLLKLSPSQRKGVDACARYLSNHKAYLRYDVFLEAGFPIATGVIEGTCRYLVKDRMDRTGARWGLEGAEAVLKLRSLQKTGDFEAYWEFHLEQEKRRNHLERPKRQAKSRLEAA